MHQLHSLMLLHSTCDSQMLVVIYDRRRSSPSSTQHVTTKWWRGRWSLMWSKVSTSWVTSGVSSYVTGVHRILSPSKIMVPSPASRRKNVSPHWPHRSSFPPVCHGHSSPSWDRHSSSSSKAASASTAKVCPTAATNVRTVVSSSATKAWIKGRSRRNTRSVTIFSWSSSLEDL